MNWKAEALEKLQKLDPMQKALHNIPVELSRLEIDARTIRGANLDGPAVKTSGSKREDALLNNLVHRQELAWNLEQAKLWVDTVQDALCSLTSEEKTILSRLYICPERGALERLCLELGVEQSSIYRKREKALRRFTQALYGYTET